MTTDTSNFGVTGNLFVFQEFNELEGGSFDPFFSFSLGYIHFLSYLLLISPFTTSPLVFLSSLLFTLFFTKKYFYFNYLETCLTDPFVFSLLCLMVEVFTLSTVVISTLSVIC